MHLRRTVSLITPIPLAALVGLAACAPVQEPVTGPVAETVQPLPPGEVRWTIVNRPTVDLWYHGLATIGFHGPAAGLPIHPAGYPERMGAAKRAAAAYPSQLDSRAEEFRAIFEASPRYGSLHFLPLNFPTGEMFLTTLQRWIQVGGDPRRVTDPNLAQAVAFLSRQFPTDAERRAIGGWLEVLAEEERAFYGAHRQRQAAELTATVAAAQAEWDALAPRLRPVLDVLQLNQGEILVSPAIGAEGRMLELGRRYNRVAVLAPEAGRPADVVWAAVHEMMYPFVNGVLEDQLSPAQLRDADRPILARRAAIRAGAIALAQVAPDAVARYREAHLRWAGATVPASAAERERAFERAYPLQDPLPAALASGIETLMRPF
jgi:hypothetical protein